MNLEYFLMVAMIFRRLIVLVMLVNDIFGEKKRKDVCILVTGCKVKLR